MKTKEEFLRQWRYRLAGLALYGSTSDLKDGPVARAARVFEITQDVDTLLGAMYDDLAQEAKPQLKVRQP